MLIRLLTSYSDNRRGYHAGEIINIADADAARLIGRQLAEHARVEPVETTAKPPLGERAVRKFRHERRG